MIFYTYAAAVLGQIAHIGGAAVTMALLAWGVGGVIGSLAAVTSATAGVLNAPTPSSSACWP